MLQCVKNIFDILLLNFLCRNLRTFNYFQNKISVKKSNLYTGLYRPLGLQKVEAPKMSRKSAHEGGMVVSHTHRPPLPPGDIPGAHFC
jgi:hypothetical protein